MLPTFYYFSSFKHAKKYSKFYILHFQFSIFNFQFSIILAFVAHPYQKLLFESAAI
jgi:hypothetical protein